MAKQVTVTEQAWNEIWNRFPDQVLKVAQDRAGQGDVDSLSQLVDSGVLMKHFVKHDYELAGVVLEILLNCVDHDRDEDEDARLLDRWFDAYGDARDEVLDGLLLRVTNAGFVDTLFELGGRLRVLNSSSETALGRAVMSNQWDLMKSILYACDVREDPPLINRADTIFDYLVSSNFALSNFPLFVNWLGNPDEVSRCFRACAASAVLKKTQTVGVQCGMAVAIAYADFQMPPSEIELLPLVSAILGNHDFYKSPACLPVLKNLVSQGVVFERAHHPVAHAIKADNAELLAEFAKLKIPPPKDKGDPEGKYKTLVASLAAKTAMESVKQKAKQNADIARIIKSHAPGSIKLRAA